MANEFEHTLVVGGTGMLAGATRVVAERSAAVTLVARRKAPMTSLVGDVSTANLVTVDYTDVSAFAARLEDARRSSGAFDLVIAWIHTRGDAALTALRDLLAAPQTRETRFIHVIGSRGPAVPRPSAARLPSVTYQRVLLGHVDEGGARRWLTHDEISGGVLDALDGAGDIVVGTLPG